MDRTEKVTLTNMCMVYQKDKVLVLNRTDPVWPGLTFPGGHVNPHESFHDSVVREVQEETGLTVKQPELVGVKQFYDQNQHRYLVFFYKVDKFSGKLHSSAEGKIFWLKKRQLFEQRLAVNFDRDLPVFFKTSIGEHILDGKRDELF